MSLQALSRRAIWNAIVRRETGQFGANVHYYPAIGSTNDMARELAQEHAPHGTLVVADEQLSGRGRMGRTWVAPPRTSLLMSLILRPALTPAQVYRAVMAAGVALVEACEQEAGVTAAVKWPNDLLIENRKFAGILPETAVVGDRLAWIVIGMGVNVNQLFAPDDPLAQTATSLRAATGAVHNRADLIGAIMARLHKWSQRLDEDSLTVAWRDRCITLGQRVSVKTPGSVVEGMAQSIDDQGALWVQDETGTRQRISVGEATLI